MQKIAQKRGLLNKLREMTDIGGIAAEKVFNPEFEKIMNKLRDETDDPVRSIATGEQIGKSNVAVDGISLKDLLASAKSNINRREYMRAIGDLGRFHKKMFDITKILSNFQSNIEQVHEQFLFKDLDDESKNYLKDLRERFTAQKKSSVELYLVKNANILDFLANIGTERGRALSAWEKRYPKQVGKLKKDISFLLSSSERLFSTLNSTLKEMATARATRHPDKYIESSHKITKAYDSYDKVFRDFYEANVKGFLEKQQFVQPPAEVPAQPTPQSAPQSAPQSTPEQSSKVEKSVDPLSFADTVPLISPQSQENIPFDLVNKIDKTDPVPPPNMTSDPITPNVTNIKKMTPEEMRAFEAEHLKDTLTHYKFYNALQKMSTESQYVLASFIRRYASTIKNSDPKTAIKLFQISRSIEA